MDHRIEDALRRFAADAENILGPLDALYCFGSAVYGDFHPGYSDLDFFLVASRTLTEKDFQAFHALREGYRAGSDPYLRVLEGECLSRSAIRNDIDSPVIYWGSSRDLLNRRWGLRTFSLRGLIDRGVLICGQEIRDELPGPTDAEMLADVKNMLDTVREHGGQSTSGVHAADWLFLICQSLYFLRTGEVTGKTAAARWVLKNEPLNFRIVLERVIQIRLDPSLGKMHACQAFLASLAPINRAACDVLERAYLETIEE